MSTWNTSRPTTSCGRQPARLRRPGNSNISNNISKSAVEYADDSDYQFPAANNSDHDRRHALLPALAHFCGQKEAQAIARDVHQRALSHPPLLLLSSKKKKQPATTTATARRRPKDPPRNNNATNNKLEQICQQQKGVKPSTNGRPPPPQPQRAPTQTHTAAADGLAHARLQKKQHGSSLQMLNDQQQQQQKQRKLQQMQQQPNKKNETRYHSPPPNTNQNDSCNTSTTMHSSQERIPKRSNPKCAKHQQLQQDQAKTSPIDLCDDEDSHTDDTDTTTTTNRTGTATATAAALPPASDPHHPKKSHRNRDAAAIPDSPPRHTQQKPSGPAKKKEIYNDDDDTVHPRRNNKRHRFHFTASDSDEPQTQPKQQSQQQQIQQKTCEGINWNSSDSDEPSTQKAPAAAKKRTKRQPNDTTNKTTQNNDRGQFTQATIQQLEYEPLSLLPQPKRQLNESSKVQDLEYNPFPARRNNNNHQTFTLSRCSTTLARRRGGGGGKPAAARIVPGQSLEGPKQRQQQLRQQQQQPQPCTQTKTTSQEVASLKRQKQAERQSQWWAAGKQGDNNNNNNSSMELSSYQRATRSSSKTKPKPQRNDQVIDLAQSSDDDDEEEASGVFERPNSSSSNNNSISSRTRRSNRFQHHDYEAQVRELSAIRIAFGKKVESQECKVMFTPSSSGPSSTTLTLSFESSSKNRRKSSNKCAAAAVVSLCIDLSQMLECQYFLDTSESLVDDDVMTNFLAMRVPKSNANGLTRFSNAYDPETNLDFEKKYIVIEFRCDEQFKDLLASMQAIDAVAAFLHHPPLSASSKSSYCMALEHESQTKRRAARTSHSKGRRRDDFLAGRADHDTLLVYPFAVDAEILDRAAVGLTELAACMRTADDAATAVAVAVADHTATPSNANNNNNGSGDDDDDNNNKLAAADEGGSCNGPVLKITVLDYQRLDAPEYFNDTLIDFFLQWVTRNGNVDDIHIFTTHFYTALEEGVNAVAKWTQKKKRPINVFEKKLIFIPINKGLHWSLCVVVNPGAIKSHLTNLKESLGTLNENILDSPFPCLLFLDALKMHNMTTVGKHIRTWLNAQWARLNPDEAIENATPFNASTMLITSPDVPRQTNSFDCGVFVCRYGFGLLRIRSRTFSYREADITELTNNLGRTHRSLFKKCITADEVFKFDMDDIHRIREELKELIQCLSKIYLPIQKERDRKEKEERLARKHAKPTTPAEEFKENTNAQTQTSNSSIALAAAAQAYGGGADSDGSSPSVGATANAIATLAISQPADAPDQRNHAIPMDIESEASINAVATRTSAMADPAKDSLDALLEPNRAALLDSMMEKEAEVQMVSKPAAASSSDPNDKNPLRRPSAHTVPIPRLFTDNGLELQPDDAPEDI